MKTRGSRAVLVVAGTMFLMLAATGWATLASAEELTMMSAVNKAGRQRMLTQRMVKAYCQIGLNVRRDEAREQLRQAVAQFDSQLAELNRFAPNLQLSESLAAVGGLWVPFKKIITGPYSRENAEQVAVLNEELLQATQLVATQLEAVSGRPSARLVNLAGRQRMLSQRIAKFYMLRELGFQTPQVLDGLNSVKGEFLAAHAELRASPRNTDEINKLLDAVNVQWQFLDFSLANKAGSLAEFVALTTEKIVQAMDQATARYEALGG